VFEVTAFLITSFSTMYEVDMTMDNGQDDGTTS
jgi:hypothetical protein